MRSTNPSALRECELGGHLRKRAQRTSERCVKSARRAAETTTLERALHTSECCVNAAGRQRVEGGASLRSILLERPPRLLREWRKQTRTRHCSLGNVGQVHLHAKHPAIMVTQRLSDASASGNASRARRPRDAASAAFENPVDEQWFVPENRRPRCPIMAREEPQCCQHGSLGSSESPSWFLRTQAKPPRLPAE